MNKDDASILEAARLEKEAAKQALRKAFERFVQDEGMVTEYDLALGRFQSKESAYRAMIRRLLFNKREQL
ncbi:MAG: hypothetical protein JOY96_09670 [Verrucomicrobia bacterium]|nr:hypothetical protein [Verrucomicrobiota bacterium]MBV9674277.1 hypothetical protein [Verrucomicrobiota bacterium]